MGVAVGVWVWLGSGVRVGLGASVGVLVGLGVVVLQAESAIPASKSINSITPIFFIRKSFFTNYITLSLTKGSLYIGFILLRLRGSENRF